MEIKWFLAGFWENLFRYVYLKSNEIDIHWNPSALNSSKFNPQNPLLPNNDFIWLHPISHRNIDHPIFIHFHQVSMVSPILWLNKNNNISPMVFTMAGLPTISPPTPRFHVSNEKKGPWLFRVFKGLISGIILPSYIGVIINHYKDLY